MYLELRRGQKEDFMEVERTRVGLDYRIVNKFMCSLVREWLCLISEVC